MRGGPHTLHQLALDIASLRASKKQPYFIDTQDLVEEKGWKVNLEPIKQLTYRLSAINTCILVESSLNFVTTLYDIEQSVLGLKITLKNDGVSGHLPCGLMCSDSTQQFREFGSWTIVGTSCSHTVSPLS